MIRVVLGEDHAIVRAGLRQTLALEPDLTVVGEAADGLELLRCLEDERPDVVLADMTMPHLAGLDLIKAIRDRHADLPILVLSMHSDVQVVSRVLRAGASGYVTKDSDPAILGIALRRVAAGERYVDPELAQRMVLEAAAIDADAAAASLSDREYQVLTAIARGASPANLAQELGLSTKTVSAHKIRLMRKLGLSSTAQLVRFALSRNIVD